MDKRQPQSIHIVTYSGASTVVKGFVCGLCGASAGTQDANATFSHYCGPYTVGTIA